MNSYTRETLAKTVDFALLKPQLTQREVIAGCELAVRYGFFSVCVLPYWVPTAVQVLNDSEVKVGTVIGFPLGGMPASVKAYEAQRAISDGAGELDMVINFGALKSRQDHVVAGEIAAVLRLARAVPGGDEGKAVVVKVIIETCYLTQDEKVRACQIAKRFGADFVKTSTGLGVGGATVEDVKLMRSIVGDKIGVKAAGGIRTLEFALKLLEAGANRLGTSHGVEIVEALP